MKKWAIIGSCLLAACGGEDGSGGTGSGGTGGVVVTPGTATPTPMPAPDATPAPTPTPTPITYQTLPLTSSAQFDTEATYVRLDQRHNSEAFFDDLEVSYDAAGRRYTFEGLGWANTFGPSNLTPVAELSFEDYYSVSDGLTTNYLTLFRSGGENPFPEDRYSHVTYSIWSRNAPELGTVFAVAGIRTEPTDLPRTGSATLQGIVHASAVAGQDPFFTLFARTDSLLAIDFAKAEVSMTVILAGRRNGQRITFGPLTGTARLGASGEFSGALTGPDGYAGTLHGALYGPRAAEAGLTFVLNRASDFGRMAGVAIAK